MSDPFLGEIKTVGFSFAPQGFAFCNGQMLPITQYSALYAVIGIQYGGNGTSNFALPNLQAAAPMHWGSGPGLTPRTVGEAVGTPNVTLALDEMPAHIHGLNAGAVTPPNPSQNVATPTAQAMIGPSNPNMAFSDVATPLVAFSPTAIGMVGGSQSHENRHPLMALNFIIALQGIFPSRG